MRHPGQDGWPLSGRRLGDLDRQGRRRHAGARHRQQGLQLCAKVTDTAKWSSGPRTFQIACTIDVLSDDPVTVGVAYQDTNATKDPKGPKLVIRRVPWDGILASTYRGAQ